MTCPRDTNGDGNCGQRYCPFCGELREKRVKDLRKTLVGVDHDERYQTNAIFHAEVNALADMMITLVDALAVRSDEQDRIRAEAMRREMMAFPRIIIDPDLPMGTMRIQPRTIQPRTRPDDMDPPGLQR